MEKLTYRKNEGVTSKLDLFDVSLFAPGQGIRHFQFSGVSNGTETQAQHYSAAMLGAFDSDAASTTGEEGGEGLGAWFESRMKKREERAREEEERGVRPRCCVM